MSIHSHDNELEITRENMQNPQGTRETILAPAPEPKKMSRRAAFRFGSRKALEAGVIAAAASAGGLVGDVIQNSADSDKIRDTEQKLEVQVQSAANRRYSVGTNNLNVLYRFIDAAGQPISGFWDSDRDAHAQSLALDIERTPELRDSTKAAFLYACEAMQARNYASDPSQGKTTLSVADEFVALGLAYNPQENELANQGDAYYPRELNAIQAFMTNLTSNLAPTPEEALNNASLIQASTVQFGRARNLDPAFVDSLTDPSVSYADTSAGTVLVDTCSAVSLSLTNIAMTIGVPFEKGKSGL